MPQGLEAVLLRMAKIEVPDELDPEKEEEKLKKKVKRKKSSSSGSSGSNDGGWLLYLLALLALGIGGAAVEAGLIVPP